MKKIKDKIDQDNEEAYGDTHPITPDRAFIESDGHSLNGITLHAYNPERMWAADAMGLRYGNLTEAQVKQFRRTSIYPGMAGDIGIVLWLCSEEDMETIRAARRDPSGYESVAIEFATKHGMVSPKQAKFWDAYKVFMRIMGEVHAAYGEPEKKTQEKQE
jgi:hypothetical protein